MHSLVTVMDELGTATSTSQRTACIQAGLDQASALGGGTVIIPPGTWEIGTIHLSSHVTLQLSANAVLRASTDLANYPQTTQQDANKDRQPYHLIVIDDAENVTICGTGTIDGNGMAFWQPPMRELARQGIDVAAYCDEHDLPEVYRNANHPWFREKSARVSPMFEAKHARRLTLRDITIANSPGWTLHCHNCDHLHIHGITIANNLFGPNTDGIDLNGCRDVRISDCDLTCGDDAIILKSMADARPCERVSVTNCIISTNCAALGLGAEVIYAIRDVAFTNCIIRQALRAFQIQLWDAGLIENVVVSNITGCTHTQIPLQRALYIDIGDNARDPAMRADGRNAGWGTVRNVQFSNISLRTRGRCVFTAPDGARMDDIVLRDVHLRLDAVEDPAVTVPRYFSSQMSTHCPEARVARAAVVAQNCHRLQLHNVQVTWPGEDGLPDHTDRANEESDGLNPHHARVPMHGLWTRGCENLINNSPFLRGWQHQ